mmetsp:Transcript_4215/g.16467  ORF Transcript_4215/g.16467 Transcript_4215/m.16467 type:complete len:200 (+) Transcript_4215:256-855(+)
MDRSCSQGQAFAPTILKSCCNGHCRMPRQRRRGRCHEPRLIFKRMRSWSLGTSCVAKRRSDWGRARSWRGSLLWIMLPRRRRRLFRGRVQLKPSRRQDCSGAMQRARSCRPRIPRLSEESAWSWQTWFRMTRRPSARWPSALPTRLIREFQRGTDLPRRCWCSHLASRGSARKRWRRGSSLSDFSATRSLRASQRGGQI